MGFAMIGFLWLVFNMSLYFMMIVQLNVLISIVAETYAEVKATQDVTTLDQRAQMAEEAMVHHFQTVDDKLFL